MRARSPDSLDRIVTAGVIGLLIACPLALGAVHLWPTALAEALIFALSLVWTLKLYFAGVERQLPRVFDRGFLLAAALLVGWVMLALVPLPPSVLHGISPHTYRLYENSLGGWPGEEPYRWLDDMPDSLANNSTGAVLLPTPNEVRWHGVVVPYRQLSSNSSGSIVQRRQPNVSSRNVNNYRTLSIQPALTRSWLLKLVAYFMLFGVVTYYPFGTFDSAPRAELRFVRTVLSTVLIMGLCIAILGIIGEATWNGKVLWFFVPQDWGTPQLFRGDRARGPFINADHFANYLSLVFPLSLACALFPTFIGGPTKESVWRIISAAIAFLIFCAILLSLSRGGWISAIAGVATLFWLTCRLPPDRRPRLVRSRLASTITTISMLAALLVACLLFVGSSSRGVLDQRIQETVNGVKMDERLMLWRNSLTMLADFPVFGVGLGCWPELFSHYVSAPWSGGFFREAHNDYAQFAAETGVVGIALLLMLFAKVTACLRGGLSRLRSGVAPVYFALIGGFVGMALHEFVDFSLHIPSNAILLVLLVGIAMRIALRSRPGPGQQRTSIKLSIGWALPGIAGTVALMLIALLQPKLSYPYDFNSAVTPSEARALVETHPGSAYAHLMLVAQAGDAMSVDRKVAEIQSAAWLQPTNPSIRDSLAGMLYQAGMDAKAEKEIAESVYYSPDPGRHYYLTDRTVPWLSSGQVAAIETGFNRAIAAKISGGVEGFATFEMTAGHSDRAAELYASAAADASDTEDRYDYLLKAGSAYAKARLSDRAEKEFRAAAMTSPHDSRAYEYLATQVYGPAQDLNRVKAAINEGLAAGADTFSLNQAMADAAQKCGDVKFAEAAQLNSVALRPSDPDALSRLGRILMAEGKYAEASSNFQQVTVIEPESAPAHFDLALAQESVFRFNAANQSFRDAIRLQPDNTWYRKRYSEFQAKLGNVSPNTTVSYQDHAEEWSQ